MNMMTPQVYKRLIISGIQDLPPEVLAEVTNFIYFLRKQLDDPDAFAEEQYSLLLGEELAELNENALHHLDTEIAGYEQRFPHE